MWKDDVIGVRSRTASMRLAWFRASEKITSSFSGSVVRTARLAGSRSRSTRALGALERGRPALDVGKALAIAAQQPRAGARASRPRRRSSPARLGDASTSRGSRSTRSRCRGRLRVPLEPVVLECLQPFPGTPGEAVGVRHSAPSAVAARAPRTGGGLARWPGSLW